MSVCKICTDCRSAPVTKNKNVCASCANMAHRNGFKVSQLGDYRAALQYCMDSVPVSSILSESALDGLQRLRGAE